MSVLHYATSSGLSNFWKKLDKVSVDTKKSKVWHFANFLRCFVKIGSGFSDYLNYELWEKSNAEIKEYATIKTQDYFYEIVSPAKYKTYFTVKPNFLKNFAKYIERDSFNMGTREEFDAFLSRNEKIVRKPVDGIGGGGVSTLVVSEIEDKDALFNDCINNNVLLEGFVKQHHEISEFASTSVNTIRVMSFAYDGKSEIIGAFMRIGNGTADVDNFHAGGMGVEVDIETGILKGQAVDKNCVRYIEHPMSHKKFDGFQIPNWDIVKKTVLEAALQNENIHCVGWDVAVTENGCTFIEGNRRPGYDLVQVVCGRGRKDIMRHCLEIVNKAEGTNYKV